MCASKKYKLSEREKRKKNFKKKKKERVGWEGEWGSIGFFFFLKVAGFYLVCLRGEKESRNGWGGREGKERKEVFINNNNKFLYM